MGLQDQKTGSYQVIILIPPLISLSHSIKVFSSKWQSIRTKLEDLFSNLTAVENWEESSENLSLHVTLESILSTLKTCDDLANRCLELSYSGKLLMQSDLHIVCSRIDTHVKSLSDIYAMGLQKQSYALVVSRPNVSASRDDMWFYVNDLLNRLRIGSSDMKRQALVAFKEVIQEDDRYVKICVEIDGFMSFLVNLLDFQELEIQEEVAKCVCLISRFEFCKSVLIGVGVIYPLIRVLESGNLSSKEYAARCLIKLTENSENSWSISAHGGVTFLLKICHDNVDNGGELVGLACGVLKNLVGVEEIKRFIIEERVISVLVNLVRCKDEVTQMCSLDLLQTMAYGDEPIRKMMVQEGGLIRTLVRFFDPKSSFSTRTREVAFKGIVNIYTSSLNLLINYGFLDHILYFLRHGEVSIQELALRVAFWLCGTSDAAKKFMGDKGFMPVLVKFLDSKVFEIREMAAEMLCSMVIEPKNRKKFVQNEENVGIILRMLDPGEVNSGNKKLLLSIVMSLTSSHSGRKKIVNSGYLKNIEKLAQNGVPDAKKIVRKLYSNRFRSILSGLWHS